jgi:L-amino acid N-acyltransferase YncA
LIRRATPNDAPAIVAIWNHTIRETTITFNPVEKTEAEVASLINDATPCYVYETENTVQGYARYFPFRGGEGYSFSVEHKVMLTKVAQGTGVGRALMTVLCDHANAVGMHMMHAGISAENPKSVDFHIKCGFTTLAILPEVGFKFGRWIDLVLMQKRL